MIAEMKTMRIDYAFMLHGTLIFIKFHQRFKIIYALQINNIYFLRQNNKKKLNDWKVKQ